MSRDKIRDDKLFNCSQKHETEYVSRLYIKSKEVENFIKQKCSEGEIENMTHEKLYILIEKELGYSTPQ